MNKTINAMVKKLSENLIIIFKKYITKYNNQNKIEEEQRKIQFDAKTQLRLKWMNKRM